MYYNIYLLFLFIYYYIYIISVAPSVRGACGRILTGGVEPDIGDVLLRSGGGEGCSRERRSRAERHGVTEDALGGMHGTDDGTGFRNRRADDGARRSHREHSLSGHVCNSDA